LCFGQQDDLAAVLDRASKYVDVYEEEQLGSLLASESYLQRATYLDERGVNLGREQRFTEGDFLILLLDDDRVGIRMVTSVDRARIQKKEKSFEAIADDTPEGIRKRLAAVRDESTRYNIGAVLRTINVPTFALRIVRKNEVGRFSFKKQGTSRISGIETWELRFREERAPTLTRGLNDESLFSSGSLWIEPGTGRILKTDYRIQNPFTKPGVEGRITVTYVQHKALGMLVPSEMTERYNTDLDTVDCTANYSNFRRFNVDISATIGTTPPR
jgi:hypothetical protein